MEYYFRKNSVLVNFLFGINLLIILMIMMMTMSLLGCKKVNTPQNAQSFEQSQLNQNKPSETTAKGHWPEHKLPLELKVSEDFNEKEAELIKKMLVEWESATLTQVKFFYDDFAGIIDPQYESIQAYYDNDFVIYKKNYWFPDISEKALAVTQYFGSKENIGTPYEYVELDHVDIFVNYRHFKFSSQIPPEKGQYDLGTVILHEVGHLLGLAHEGSTFNSVMTPHISQGQYQRSLWPLDKSRIQRNYGIKLSDDKTTKSEIEDQGNQFYPRNSSEGGIPVRGLIELMSDGTRIHRQFSN